MMHRGIRRPRLVVLALVALLAVVVSGVAAAVWTTRGGGTAAGAVGSGTVVAISDIRFDGALFPGGGTTVRFTLANTSSGDLRIGRVFADASQGTNGISGLPDGCSAGDFHFDDVALDRDVPQGGSVAATGTLRMDATGQSNACKNARPVLHLKAE